MSYFGAGNHDRAWNDPPVLGYRPSKADGGAGAKRTPLNKRVPFPTTGAPCREPAPRRELPVYYPPANLLTVLPFYDLSPAGETGNTVVEVAAQDSGKLIEQVSRTLEEALNDSAETESKRADISTRLHNLSSDWKQGKLNSDIQQRLVRLCDHLKENDLPNANSVQVALAVDYTAECAPWITALRRIIANHGQKISN